MRKDRDIHHPHSSAATDEVRCYGCGSAWTDAELIEARKSNPKLVSCCPERKPLDITAWMARAVAAEEKVRKLSEPQEVKEPTDEQVYYAARKLALSAPGMYEDASHKGSLRPNTAAITVSRMMLDAAIRMGGPLSRPQREPAK